MIWQDIVVSIGVLMMSYALVPQIIKGFKLKRSLITFQTSIITSISLYTLSFAMFTLKLYFSSSMNFLAGTLWTILFLQNIKYSK